MHGETVQFIWCMCVRASYMKMTRGTNLMQVGTPRHVQWNLYMSPFSKTPLVFTSNQRGWICFNYPWIILRHCFNYFFETSERKATTIVVMRVICKTCVYFHPCGTFWRVNNNNYQANEIEGFIPPQKSLWWRGQTNNIDHYKSIPSRRNCVMKNFPLHFEVPDTDILKFLKFLVL
jgi:hypothetical protein